MRHPRPYDAAMPNTLLRVVEKRREKPDGRRHDVPLRYDEGMGRKQYSYPLRNMKPGDYFLVPLGNRTLVDYRSFFKKKEKVLDVELSIRKVATADGPMLQVCLVYGGPVSELKKAAGVRT